MGFLKDLLNGHEAFFAASDKEKGWGGTKKTATSDMNKEEEKSD